jgi:heat shock protein HslJ
MSEVPEIETTAIVDIDNGSFIQEGRKPWLEENLVTKSFVGKYLWQSTKNNDGSVVEPSKSDTFTMIFDGNRVSLGTDCNTGSSEFTPPTGTSTGITFGPVVSTRMFCESSEEGPYFKMIESIKEYSENEEKISFELNDGRMMFFEKEKQKLEYESTTTKSTE